MSVYDDGESREFDAETNCTDASCVNPMQTYQQFKASEYLGASGENHLPILIRMDWPDSDPTPMPALIAQFQTNVRDMLRALNVKTLVARAGRPLD